MMADPRQIEQELREYLEREPNLRRGDRMAYLMAIINKHFEIDKIEHNVNKFDFDQLISSAKTAFPNTTLPMVISRQEIHSSEASLVLLLEAFIGYLNKHKLLKRLVRFDHRR